MTTLANICLLSPTLNDITIFIISYTVFNWPSWLLLIISIQQFFFLLSVALGCKSKSNADQWEANSCSLAGKQSTCLNTCYSDVKYMK